MQLHWSAAIELPNGYELATFGYIPNKSFGFPLERGSQTSDAFLGAVEEASMRDPSMVAAVAASRRAARVIAPPSVRTRYVPRVDGRALRA